MGPIDENDSDPAQPPTSQSARSFEGKWIAVGAAIGCGVGVALNQLAMGIALGVAAGAIIASVRGRR